MSLPWWYTVTGTIVVTLCNSLHMNGRCTWRSSTREVRGRISLASQRVADITALDAEYFVSNFPDSTGLRGKMPTPCYCWRSCTVGLTTPCRGSPGNHGVSGPHSLRRSVSHAIRGHVAMESVRGSDAARRHPWPQVPLRCLDHRHDLSGVRQRGAQQAHTRVSSQGAGR